ncbi:MAG: 30S ribosome-binding factor RbfA [Acidobacteria bacterium]|nr:30S ribosome-binding factor RbfA [Acidobacteriota bacterium]
MPLSHRTERIAEQLREEVSQILATEVADPGVGLVTVTRVKVTPDLSLARVYWTLLGDVAERKRTTKALQRAAAFVRHVLATRVTLRRVPEVHFQYDEGLAAHQRVEELLHEIHEADAARVQDTAAAPAAEPSAPAAAEAPEPHDPDPAV